MKNGKIDLTKNAGTVNMELETKKKLLLGSLIAVIVFAFGKAIYHILNPPEVMLTRGEQATFESVMENNKCQGLYSDYEESKVDGYISYNYAVPKMELCQSTIIKRYQFDAALQMFMKDAYEREGLINTPEE